MVTCDSLMSRIFSQQAPRSELSPLDLRYSSSKDSTGRPTLTSPSASPAGCQATVTLLSLTLQRDASISGALGTRGPISIRVGAGLNQREQVEELTHSLTWQEVELLKLRPLGTEVHGELRHAARHGWTSRQPEGRGHGHPGKGPIRAQLHSLRDVSQANRKRQRNAKQTFL